MFTFVKKIKKMSLIKNFRDYTGNTIIEVTKKTFIPVGLTYFVTAIIIALIMTPVFMMIFGADVMDISNIANIGNEEMMQEQSLRMMENFNPRNMGILFFVYLLMFIIMSWFLNFAISFIHRFTTTKEIALAESLKESFNGMVFKVFFLFLIQFILIIVVYFILAMVAGVLMMITPILGFIGLFGVIVFIYLLFIKLSLSIPILVISKKGIGESLVDSYNTITYQKAFKYFLFIFVLSIALVFVLLVLDSSILSCPILLILIKFIIFLRSFLRSWDSPKPFEMNENNCVNSYILLFTSGEIT